MIKEFLQIDVATDVTCNKSYPSFMSWPSISVWLFQPKTCCILQALTSIKIMGICPIIKLSKSNGIWIVDTKLSAIQMEVWIADSWPGSCPQLYSPHFKWFRSFNILYLNPHCALTTISKPRHPKSGNIPTGLNPTKTNLKILNPPIFSENLRNF